MKPVRITHDLNKGDKISGITLHYERSTELGVQDIFFRLAKDPTTRENYITMTQDALLTITIKKRQSHQTEESQFDIKEAKHPKLRL
jgi:hypothetical protein